MSSWSSSVSFYFLISHSMFLSFVIVSFSCSLWRLVGRREPQTPAIFLHGGQRRRDAEEKQRSPRSRNWSGAVRVSTATVTGRRPFLDGWCAWCWTVATDVVPSHIADGKSIQSNRLQPGSEQKASYLTPHKRRRVWRMCTLKTTDR